MSDAIKFGKVSFYSPRTNKGIIETEDGNTELFDASKITALKDNLTALLGNNTEDWEAVELLEKNPLEVIIQPNVDGREIEILD